MEDPILWPILLQIVLIALNAIFACAEIAIISINDNKLAQLVSQGDKRAVRLARLTSRPAQFLATIQIAITLSGFLGGAFAADNFSDPLVAMLVDAGVPIPAKTLNTIAVVVITLVLSYITLVFGELVPKRLAMKKGRHAGPGPVRAYLHPLHHLRPCGGSAHRLHQRHPPSAGGGPQRRRGRGQRGRNQNDGGPGQREGRL